MTLSEQIYSLMTGQVIADITGLPDVDPRRSGEIVAYGPGQFYTTFTASDLGKIYLYDGALVADLVAMRESVSGRIYPNILPQGERALPAIIYRITDNRPVNDFDGPAQMDMVILDIWCYGQTRKQAQSVGKGVRKALDGFKSKSTQYIWYFNDSDDYDKQRECYIQHFEFRIALNRVLDEVAPVAPEILYITNDDGEFLTDNLGILLTE